MATQEQIVGAAERRAGVLEYVRTSIETRGYPPTLTEIATATGVDRATTIGDVRVLASEGYLEVDKGATRGLRLAGHRVVLERIAP